MAFQTIRGEPVNLDHLVLSVRTPATGNVKDFLLSEYLSDEGRTSTLRVVADFDYSKLRQDIDLYASIAEDVEIYPPTGFITIHSEGLFFAFLTQIQCGHEPVGYHPTRQLPNVVLQDTPHALTSLPPASPQSPPTSRAHGSGPSPPAVASPPQPGSPIQWVDSILIESFNEQDLKPIHERSYFDGFLPNPEYEDDTWPQVCRFFNCDEAATSARVPRLQYPLEGYQLHTVWRAIRQIARLGLASYMIADESGLGKTVMALAIAAIFADAKRTYREVQAEWNTQLQTNHLPPDQRRVHICPTQSTRSLLCPCVIGGLTHQLVNRVPDFPTIVCVPPELVHHWVAETVKWNGCRGFVADSNWPSYRFNSLGFDPLPLQQPQDGIYGRLHGVFNDDGQDPDKTMPEYGLSFSTVIVSYESVQRFVDNFITPGGRHRERSLLGCGFIFLDQAAEYDGETSPSQALKLLGGLNQDGVPMAIGLSAGLRRNPAAWDPFVRHLCARSPGDAIDRINFSNPRTEFYTAYQRHMEDFTMVVKILEAHRNAWTPEMVQQIKQYDRIYERYIKRFAIEMMSIRTRGTLFRRQPVSPDDTGPDIRSCDIEDESHKDSVKKVNRDIANALDAIYQDERAHVGPMVSYRDVVAKFSAGKGNGVLSNTFYPGLVHSIVTGALGEDSCERDIAVYATEFTDREPGGSQGQVPVFRLVSRDIPAQGKRAIVTNTVVNIAGLRPIPERLHILILSRTTAAAFVAASELYPMWDIGMLDMFYVHSGVDRSTRGIYLDRIRDNTVIATELAVLITTPEMFKTGLHLPNLRTVIITEVLNPEHLSMIRAAVNRKKETERPEFIQLYHEDCIMDKINGILFDSRDKEVEDETLKDLINRVKSMGP